MLNGRLTNDQTNNPPQRRKLPPRAAIGDPMIILAALLDAADFAGSIVTLAPSEAPGYTAQITLDNIQTNGPQDERTVPLSIPGVDALVTFDWDSGENGADSIIVTPPDGMACDPASCVLEVPENDTGVLYLYEWTGM